jgi:hypothetical protein
MAPSSAKSTPSLLSQLQQARGWSELQALEALGDYLLDTEPGRALRRELDSNVATQAPGNRARDAA